MKPPAKKKRPPSPFGGKRLLVALLVLLPLLIILVSLWVVLSSPRPGVAETADHSPRKLNAPRPTILLTGFKPYTEDHTPNASWEAIKQLDGQQWNGYQLVSKQAKVVWGAPLKQLEEWMTQYQPVAIFSFGQSRRKTFTLESQAFNERKDKVDNLNERPKNTVIVEDGPKQYPASIKGEKIARLLGEKGFPTQVSDDAGRYLCNEMLYCLEHLKATKKLETSVLFCHVPELDSSVQDKKVTVEYLQQFVKNMLESWYEVDRTHQESLKDPRYPEVKEMVRRYFRTWSEQDMAGYNRCFLPEATIQFIDAGGEVSTSLRQAFIASQQRYHRTAPERAIEVPETIDIRFEGKLARAVVFWKLTAGQRTETGYDHFTLLKQDGNWRIVNLTFYASPQLASR